MKVEARALLEDVLAYGQEAVDAVGDRSAEDILAERFREHAVLRTIQIMGEAAAQALKLDGAVAAVLPELRQAVGVRNILVHGYAKVRMDEVVRVVRTDLPRLLADIERLLGDDT